MISIMLMPKRKINQDVQCLHNLYLKQVLNMQTVLFMLKRFSKGLKEICTGHHVLKKHKQVDSVN